MATVHITLQKKGGVGKSLITTFWMQFLDELGYPVTGIDTDPSNRSFSEFKGLPIAGLEIMDSNDEIAPRRFDAMVDTICALGENDHIVIDTGTSCYVALFAYLKHNRTFEIIKDASHQVYVHTPIMGGSDILYTIASLEKLVEAFPDIPFIIWKNRYHGDLKMDDKEFGEFKVYSKLKKHIVAEIELPLKNPGTFGKDVELLMAKRLTFKAAINSSMPVMVRQRLSIFWNEVSAAMKNGLVFGEPPREIEEIQEA